MKSIEGTFMEKIIDMNVSEKAPEVYKPRKGLVNGNKCKFNAT
jgi:hypothetical protein